MLAILLLTYFHIWIDLSLWVAVSLFSLWVFKDIVLYPLLRVAYEKGEKVGADQLFGFRGIATENINPYGYIHIRGELWRAETKSFNDLISTGSSVKVVGINGMTLTVVEECIACCHERGMHIKKTGKCNGFSSKDSSCECENFIEMK